MPILKNKIAVITGSSRGLGLAIAQAYAREGASIVISSRSPKSVQNVVDVLRSEGLRASGISCDVSNFDEVKALREHALQAFGKMDIWVNNAALSPPYGPTAHINPEDFTRVLNTNIIGTYYGSWIAMEYFVPRQEGKLINILGVGARRPQPLQNAYASSKAWLVSFTKALAEEYKDSNVGIYALSPGMMDTDMLRKVEAIEGYEEQVKRLEMIMPILAQPPEVPARKAVWLASPETDGKTGLVLHEFTRLKTMGLFLRSGINRLLGRGTQKTEVQVTSVPGKLPPITKEKS